MRFLQSPLPTGGQSTSNRANTYQRRQTTDEAGRRAQDSRAKAAGGRSKTADKGPSCSIGQEMEYRSYCKDSTGAAHRARSFHDDSGPGDNQISQSREKRMSGNQ